MSRPSAPSGASAPLTTPTAESIRAAAARLEGRAVRTPLLESRELNAAIGRRILVKAECLQRTGSFKFRGAWSHLSACAAEQLANGVVAVSSGNHAQGVALASALLGVEATIIMPEDAPEKKRAKTAAYGARLRLYDRSGAQPREEIARAFVADTGAHLVLPYDDALVISGQGTAGLEIAEQARAVGVAAADVLVPCGGGGLSSGIALALEGAGYEGRVRPVEPAGFDDWTRSLASGAPKRNDRLSGSICDAILTPEPGALTWPIGRRLFGPGATVSDRDARRAMAVARRFFSVILEPGGAAALAAALFAPEFAHAASPEAPPLIVVASGGNVDPAMFDAWTAFDAVSSEGTPV